MRRGERAAVAVRVMMPCGFGGYYCVGTWTKLTSGPCMEPRRSQIRHHASSCAPHRIQEQTYTHAMLLKGDRNDFWLK